MRTALRSLRVRFAALTFAAIYLPVAVLFLVVRVQDSSVEVEGGVLTENTVVESGPTIEVVLTALVLLPVAAALAWWLSGIAVRPVVAAVEVQRRLVEEASHELRTPLAILTNNADVLLAHPNPDLDVYREGIERSGAAAARMQATIDALLVDARGRARTLERKPVDLVRLCGGVVDELTDKVTSAGGTVRLVADGAVRLPVDEPLMERAVTNLVVNAVEHAPGASVVVAIANNQGTENAVLISVTDDGPGIPAERQTQIFDRFWTASRSGTGLGLSIARQIAEAHGGSLAVTSPVHNGRGSRFTLQLRG